MKLVVDLRLIHNSGIGTYIKNIFPLLLDHIEDVVVLGDPDIISTFEWSQKVDVISFKAKVYSITEQLLFPVKVPKCDVFWSPHFNAPLFPVNAKIKIVTIHDINHLANPHYFSLLKRKWAKLLYYNAICKSKKIITVSNFSKLEILKHFNIAPNKIVVIPGGIHQDFAKNSDKRKIDTLPEKYILFVGNIKPHKNLITLLKAYVQLNDEIKSLYRIVILGRKDGFITGDPTIFEFISKHHLQDKVIFTGQVADDTVPSIYKTANLFVFPSLYEGFGLPLLEAMACGIPVISSNSTSLPEVGGEAVLYFDPSNATDLKDKIEGVLSNEEVQNELIAKGYSQIQNFSWKTSALQHVSLVKDIF
ncbi:glycosyltransferase family 4 protein [Aquimarina brevivitae]|uniref:Glycosyltransferase involved in cell wall biosynthesis n=1 Tax=Aquimarina brevivitae TaxID=323412 RepID=A0A4Q7PFN2_9FLAO|nr:glycosyltransferase family 1 protein [Aquimarina brevivitae]RZS99281.1 glycosyltransferase involved in cell wall biosynthesis [Aquimarina brevivitae]